ncbi:DUF5686 and carboxypeptidase regulatory-like domain-containing protein [Compostibacter hankyongensis]|uniref:DUF5686 and carboxypeptidase regulatory-like domain-containing protein n=1 Tax=Compostibacter hankyongensis TaxID=1007089 RepID=A0ABP8FKU2_9BACT
MKRFTRSFFLISFCLSRLCHAQQKQVVSGTVTNLQGDPLPYAGVYLKNSTLGATTNEQGRYALELPPGSYTLICRYLGYARAESSFTLTDKRLQLDFRMQPEQVQMREVVIQGGEDPAYAIIRKAIRKRPFYENQVKDYACRLYIKDVVHLNKGPEKFMGEKVDYEGEVLDSTRSGILFLSESLSSISRQAQPPRFRQQVISSRQSGGGLGFDFPVFIDFYQNNMALFSRQMLPRGYISPIADQALHYYRYRLEGTFMEDGQVINKIRVFPKRKHEPLFSGYLNIADDSWRIHSLDLMVTRQQQLQIIDSLEIRQIHAPVGDSIWRIRNQSLSFKLKMLNFDLRGAFASLYSDYDLHPQFPPDFFDSRIVMAYDSLADKRSPDYWDSIRPLPLARAEARNFRQKDSLARVRRDSLQAPHYRDSLQQDQPPPRLTDLLWRGYRHTFYRRQPYTFHWQPLLKKLSYNTVEGFVTGAGFDLFRYTDSAASWRVAPSVRYGWNNRHLNGQLDLLYRAPSRSAITWQLSGGKRVSQINPENPINGLTNSLYTLLLKENYMKIYESYFGTLQAGKRYENGFSWSADLTWEDRYPLQNTTDFSLIRYPDKSFSSNHPEDLATRPFLHHQALSAGLSLSYQPGQKYIQYPRYKMSVGSKAPVFGLGYTKGIPNLLGSDVDYDKWFFNIRDDINMRLFGTLRYKVQAGGFLNRKSVGLPDMQHFNGNRTFYNIKYLNSFQLAPYYRYSNVAPFYTTLNAEYHLNGLLTNRIPLFNRLKWNLVLGANAFYIDPQNNYWEISAGLENIFKVLRVDVVAGYPSRDRTAVGVRVGLGGLLGELVRRRLR